METINSKVFSDRSGVKGSLSGVIDMLLNPKEHPLYLLFLIFLFYALVDVVSTFLEFGRIDGWLMAQYHFIAGYLICALYFKLVLPEYFTRKRRIRAVLYFLLLLAALVAVKLLIDQLFWDELTFSKSFLVVEFNRVFNFLILTSVVWGLYNNIKLGKSKYATEIKHEQLKVMHRSMQLSSHFVLNSLSIYQSKIIKLSPSLAKEFSDLTFLLRYSFKEFGDPNFLSEELKAVEKYLQIQRIRFPQLSLREVIAMPPIAEELPMPRMCLLTLVENVFFHGDYTDPEHPCRIEFMLGREDPDGDWKFSAAIANKVAKNGIKTRTGFGSSSVFQVLGQAFGEGFQYREEPGQEFYSLHLTIHYGHTVQNWSD